MWVSIIQNDTGLVTDCGKHIWCHLSVTNLSTLGVLLCCLILFFRYFTPPLLLPGMAHNRSERLLPCVLYTSPPARCQRRKSSGLWSLWSRGASPHRPCRAACYIPSTCSWPPFAASRSSCRCRSKAFCLVFAASPSPTNWTRGNCPAAS